MKVALTKLGMNWLYVLILPVVFFSWLSKHEDWLIPDEGMRKLYARGLIAGSIVLAVLIAWARR